MKKLIGLVVFAALAGGYMLVKNKYSSNDKQAG